MTTSAPNKCASCGAEFFYAASAHRCPGEWEAIAGELPPSELLSWDEECVRKVMSK